MANRIEQLAEGVTLYLGDCREIAPALAGVDAVVSDPPYGMAWNTDSTRFTGGNQKTGDGRSDFGAIVADNVPFDPSPWLAFPEVVLWGANHFGARLPVGVTLVWIKKSMHAFGTFLSDAEIGWQGGGAWRLLQIRRVSRRVGAQGGVRRSEIGTSLAEADRSHGVVHRPAEEWPDDSRPVHGFRHNRRCRSLAGPQIHRHRDRAQILRHRLPTHRERAFAAAHVSRAGSGDRASEARHMTRHRWSEKTVITPNKSERECLRCGIIKASHHQWDGPKELHWPEFYRGLDKIECVGTPPCTGPAKPVVYDARNYPL